MASGWFLDFLKVFFTLQTRQLQISAHVKAWRERILDFYQEIKTHQTEASMENSTD